VPLFAGLLRALRIVAIGSALSHRLTLAAVTRPFGATAIMGGWLIALRTAGFALA
jgi:hypothetical protein